MKLKNFVEREGLLDTRYETQDTRRKVDRFISPNNPIPFILVIGVLSFARGFGGDLFIVLIFNYLCLFLACLLRYSSGCFAQFTA